MAELQLEMVKEAALAAARSLGVPPLKEKQMEALISFASGKDTFVSLPTGYGKSIIYGLIPSLFDNLKGN